jgi:hypothetical protein
MRRYRNGTMFRFGSDSGQAHLAHLAFNDSPPNRSSIVERFGTYRKKKFKKWMEEKGEVVRRGSIFRCIGRLA